MLQGIDLFQTYYKYKGLNDDYKTCYTKLSNFRHVDFNHQVHNELFISDLYKDFTGEKIEEKIDNLVDFLNLYGDKIKITFMIDKNLSNTVTRVNEILSRTTSNLLYVSIRIKPGVYPVRKNFKFPLHMKLLYIDTGSNKNIYSKLFIDADAEEYPCLIFNEPMSLMLPEKYIDYTKITSLITKSFISPKNNVDCCVNLRNLCIDTENSRCLKNFDYLQRFQYDCFDFFAVFKKMKCLMLRYSQWCNCNIRQIDHIPYYCFLTHDNDYNDNNVKFERNRIIKKNNTIFVPYEIECRTCWISPYAKSQNVATLRHNRFPHVLRLSKVLPKTIFYSILKLFLQHN